MNIIYCDNAATTQTRPEVVESMLPVFAEYYGNPSSLHKFGRKAKQLLESSYAQVAKMFNCKAKEVFFTSGGTESNNIAILGAANYAKQQGLNKKHIITTNIEHSAVYGPVKQLEQEGWQVTWLKVNQEGFVDLNDLSKSLRPETLLVSIIHANNEIGTIQDIKAIGKMCRENGTLFHTDAVQSAGKVSIDVEECNIDLLSLSAHKIYGPKGIGILYVREVCNLKPIFCGGTQQKGLKPGTENLPGIIGLAKAVELRLLEMPAEELRLRSMQENLLSKLMQIPGLVINGPTDLTKRVPGNVNFSLEDVEGETLVLHLDMKGIAVSSGSACAEGSIEPSRVISALHPENQKLAFNSLRISLGLFNKAEEIEVLAEAISNIVNKLRERSGKAN
jgi:cysteine desulfurase